MRGYLRPSVATVLAALLLSSAAVAPPILADDFKAPLAGLELADGDSVVFLGDSITHQCLYTQYVEDYFYTRFPGMRLKFHNSGVGGDRAADALARFDRDVAHYKPRYVTILLGMNDGTYQPYDDATFNAYRQGMQKLLEKIQAIGATPVLMTPTMYDSRAARLNKRQATPERLEFYNSTLAYYGAWLREQAYEGGFGLVDMYGPLNALTLETRKTDAPFTLIPDAVHPAAAGQLVMAYALLTDLGLPRPLSSVSISRGPKDEAVARATGGKVTQARFTSDGLEFTFAAAALPLVVPEEAQPGAKLVKLGHRLSREALDIHGLPAGQYRLLIDGRPVGTFNAAALERHIELQENSETPQYQQALAVAELNRRRNDEAVRPLRNLWRDKKLLTRTQDQLQQQPADEALRKTAAALEEKLAGFEDQIAALQSKAQALEDRIFEGNKPVPHVYRLVRIEGK